MNAPAPIVAHYHAEWLPLTMTWLYEQVYRLNAHCSNHVLCERRSTDTAFHVPNMHVLGDQPYFLQWSHRFKKKAGITSYLPFYEHTISAVHANLIHGHFGHMGAAMYPLAKKRGLPLLVTFYGMDIHQLPRRYPRLRDQYLSMFSYASAILCEGDFMAREIIQLGCQPEKVRVHPLGVDLQKIPFTPATPADGKQPVRILIAASFRQKKGIPDALQAIANISGMYRFEVTVIGDAGKDEASRMEKNRILEVISRNNMADYVRLMGFASHQMLLAEATRTDIFLSPSRHADDGDSEGGAPVTLIEMAAAGKIVVSTTHCDIPGVVEHEKTGWLATEASIDDLTAKLHTALQERERWPDMSRNARIKTEEQFNATTQASRLAGLYKEILSHG